MTDWTDRVCRSHIKGENNALRKTAHGYRNACRWHFKCSREPCCLRNLTAEQRQVFDAVYEEARFAEGFLGSGSHFFEARDGERRMLDDVAIEIARTSPSRWRPEIWDAARRTREKLLSSRD